MSNSNIWNLSFEQFCVENKIDGGNKDKFRIAYGRAVFEVLYEGIHHEFVKQALGYLHQDVVLDTYDLAKDINNFYHEDRFQIPPFDFKAFEDGEPIEKIPVDDMQLKERLSNSFLWKSKISCVFEISPNYKEIQERVLGQIRKTTILFSTLSEIFPKSFPTSFTVVMERQQWDLFKVVNSIFIR